MNGRQPMVGGQTLAKTCHFMKSLNLLLFIIKAKLVIANTNHLLTDREGTLSTCGLLGA